MDKQNTIFVILLICTFILSISPAKFNSKINYNQDKENILLEKNTNNNSWFFLKLNRHFSNSYVDRSESFLTEKAKSFAPWLWLHKNEPDYPVSLEVMNIKFPNDMEKGMIIYNYHAGRYKYRPDAPMYTRIDKLKNNSGYLFTYGLIFAYNNCGPKAHISATGTLFGKGININKDIPLCPAGVHNGDIENVQIEVDNNFNVRKVYAGYHEWSHSFNRNDLQWNENHPILYLALGSHAVYNKEGGVHYKTLFNTDSSKSVWCGVKWCTKGRSFWKIKYPCGSNYCTFGFKASGTFVDTTGRGNLWKGPLRILDSNAFKVDPNSLSDVEKKFLKFKAVMGEQIRNDGWRIFASTLRNLLSPLFLVCSKCKNAVNSALDEGNGFYQATAPSSALISKDWWKNTDKV